MATVIVSSRKIIQGGYTVCNTLSIFQFSIFKTTRLSLTHDQQTSHRQTLCFQKSSETLFQVAQVDCAQRVDCIGVYCRPSYTPRCQIVYPLRYCDSPDTYGYGTLFNKVCHPFDESPGILPVLINNQKRTFLRTSVNSLSF